MKSLTLVMQKKLTLILSRSVALTACILMLGACQTSLVDQAEVIQPEIATAPTQPNQAKNVEISEGISVSKQVLRVEKDLWQRIRDGFQLQAHYDHPSVVRYKQRYASNQRLFDLVTQRATPFLYHIVQTAEEKDLPLELALLPIVESTFNTHAYSSEHAVGLWQFLGPTARSFGVQIDWWYDGRKDPLVATAAALEYLNVLNKQFNENWLLAIGAYNTGDGNLRRAIRRSKQDLDAIDFWSLPLAPETLSHVPKLLAIASIIADIQDYEVVLPELVNQPHYVTVDLPAQIDISQAASLIGIDYQELKALNPGYLQWATHPDAPHSLYVPKTKANALVTAVAKLNPQQFVTWDRYAIQSGDSLSSIANKLGTRVDILTHANNLKSSRIVAGESLLIPRNANSLTHLTQLPTSNRQVTRDIQAVPKKYRVRKGDNLWSIARKFDLKSEQIAVWNNIELSTLLFPGDELDFSNASSDVTNNESPALVLAKSNQYQVVRGDSIEKIGKKTGFSTFELLQWNNLSESQMIHPGQIILLAPPKIGIN